MIKYVNTNAIKIEKGAAEKYLKYLGIEDTDSFMVGPKESDYEDPYDLDNIEKLVDRLHYNFTNNKKFFLQVDSDCDGITSSSIFMNYFTRKFPKAEIEYRVHDGKEHGVILNTVPVWCDVVIIIDAGSNQLTEQELLSKQGKEVLIMDHHLVSEKCEFDNVVLVNNQTSARYRNKALSGAGVAYKVIQAYDKKYGDGTVYKDYEDLAALGIIADCMDTRTLDNNAIIMNGLKNLNSPMLKSLINFQSFKIQDKINKNSISYYIAPLINAVVRSGTLEEKESFFKGFIDVDNKEMVHTVFRGRDRYETLYDYLSRTASNLRARQNTQKEKAIESLSKIIEEQNLQENKVIILKVDNCDFLPTITGLIAMDIQKIYNRPTLIVRPVVENGKTYYRGSGRAVEAEGFKSFIKLLQKSGLVEYAEGHDNAFGVSILKENITPLTKYCNEELKDIVFDKYNEVCACINNNNFDKNILEEFADLEDCWGQGIEEPKFHFSLSNIKSSDIRVQGSNMDSLRVNYGGVQFIVFRSLDVVNDFVKNSTEYEKFDMECIGKMSTNYYNGYKNVNVMIDEIVLKPNEKSKISYSKLF